MFKGTHRPSRSPTPYSDADQDDVIPGVQDTDDSTDESLLDVGKHNLAKHLDVGKHNLAKQTTMMMMTTMIKMVMLFV